MDLDDLIVGVYCLIDETLAGITNGRRLRQRGPDPLLSDAEVLTMEIVGEFLGLDQDAAIFAYLRRHYAAWFPPLRNIHRTTFTRQAANLWAIKARIWTQVVAAVPHDPAVALIDSFPMPVCRFARARRCRLFEGEAAFGHDEGARQTFSGFRCHVRLAWPGVIAGVALAPANVSEPEIAAALAEHTTGYLIGDRNYWAPLLTDALAADGVCLLAPLRKASQDPDPTRSHYLSRIRYRIETVFGQLVERYQIKRVRARDLWHLQSRVMRKVLRGCANRREKGVVMAAHGSAIIREGLQAFRVKERPRARRPIIPHRAHLGPVFGLIACPRGAASPRLPPPSHS